MLQTRLTPEIVTRPTTEPLTLGEAKKQLEISISDTTHDDHLTALVIAARQQWEDDTDSAVCNQTWKVETQEFVDGMKLPKRPVQSITTIQYYDGTNTLQTLASTVYQLHAGRGEIRLGYQQVLPATSARWDAWKITYLCGYGTDGTNVPGVAKRAMMLLIGYHFENRDMLQNESTFNRSAYESLVLRYIRSTYP